MRLTEKGVSLGMGEAGSGDQRAAGVACSAALASYVQRQELLGHGSRDGITPVLGSSHGVI